MQNTGFKLSHEPRPDCLSFGDVSMFPFFTKKVSAPVFLGIRKLRTEPVASETMERYPHIDWKHEYSHGRVQLSPALQEALREFYFPGGMHIEMTELSRYWLVAFKAENVLSVCYMALSLEDGRKIISEK